MHDAGCLIRVLSSCLGPVLQPCLQAWCPGTHVYFSLMEILQRKAPLRRLKQSTYSFRFLHSPWQVSFLCHRSRVKRAALLSVQ